MDLSSSE